MRTNDQYFQPGDKVMEAMTDAEVEAIYPETTFFPHAKTKPGVVYCVERFEEHAYGNSVWLVGVDNGPSGIVAMYFRRVSEIQLCVRAAKHVLHPVEQEESQTV